MNRFKNLLCLLIPLLSCIAAKTQPSTQWKTQTEEGYTYQYVQADPMKARFYTLENGLTVILSVNKKEPRIQTLIGVRAGSNNDPQDHTGLAHYLEHLLFKGTDRYGSRDWKKEKPYLDEIERLYEQYNATHDAEQRKLIYHYIDSISGLAAEYAIANEYVNMMTDLGAQGTNAHTWVEETVYQEDIPANALDKYLSVQAERFRKPVFRLFHTELEAVYEEKNMGVDNDSRKMYEAMLAALFPTHNYGQQSTIGTIEHLKNPSLKAITDFYNTHYVPNNMAIVMSGDFNPAYVIKKIDEKFSYLKRGKIQTYKGPREEPITKPIVREVWGPDAESVNIAFRMPGALDMKSSVMLTLLSQVLSNGKAGLIDLNLNRQQNVLGASASVMAWKDYAVFSLSGRAKEGQSLESVKDLLLQQLNILKNGAFSGDLVRSIVNNFKRYEIQGLESNSERANALMDGFIKHRGDHWPDDVAFIDEMSKVSKAALMDFARTTLKDNYVLLYKRRGVDNNVIKVEKPSITPVAVNSNMRSSFVQQIADIPANLVAPQWLDYKKDIQRTNIGKTELLYVQNESNDLFRLYYRFDIGSWHNKKLPLAIQYLQFLGTDKYTTEQISTNFYNIACNYNISSQEDVTTISITGLQENFEKAVTLFEHLLRQCKPDEEALIALKDRLRKSRADNKLNKKAIMQGMMQYAMYGPSNPFNHQLTAQALDNLGAKALTDILHDLPDFKHTVIYYGPAPVRTISQRLTQWHMLPESFKPTPQPVKFVKAPQRNCQVLFTDYDMVQAEVSWIRNTTPYKADNAAVITLFNNYFGGSMGSVVFQDIRESKALAYSTYAVYASPIRKEDCYSALAYVGSQADKIHLAINSMNELLREMPESEKALAIAKNSIRQEIETERIIQDNIIFNYLAAQRLGIDNDYRKSIYDAINGLKFDDLKKFHQENLSGKPYTYCILASDKNIQIQDLQKYGAVKHLTPEEIFGY